MARFGALMGSGFPSVPLSSGSVGHLESFTSDGVSIVLNPEHFPVVVATWFGTPTHAVVDAYLQWLSGVTKRAQEEGTRFVVIGDTTGMDERPGPELRRHLASAIDKFQAEAGDTVLGVMTIFSNPLMRAVVTMTLFITQRQLQLVPVKGMAEAIDRARELLRQAGVEPPAGLDAETYRRPADPRPHRQ